MGHNKCDLFYQQFRRSFRTLSAIQSAMQTWTNVIASSFEFIYGGDTSSSCGYRDDVNRICFASMGSTGTVAKSSIWYDLNTGQILETDLKFNTDYAFKTDGATDAYDVQDIATHEFGHSLGLADLYGSSDSDKTMYGYSAMGETKKRTLTQDDMDGITYLYPSGTCAYTISPTNGILFVLRRDRHGKCGLVGRLRLDGHKQQQLDNHNIREFRNRQWNGVLFGFGILGYRFKVGRHDDSGTNR